MLSFSQRTVCNRRGFTTAMLAGSVGLVAGRASAADRPEFHILDNEQTETRDQGYRGTCYVYSVVAALEAAYKRAGHGTLDLSEEFANLMPRMLWLEPRASAKRHPAERENRYVMGEGGYSNGVVRMMSEQGLAIPEEKRMPYRGNRPERPAADPCWYTQFGTDSYNLNPSRFDGAALAKAKFYGIKKHHDLNAQDPLAIEKELLKGREVIWDFAFCGDRSSWLWEYTKPAQNSDGGHSMLLYGFDRSMPDKPYFFVKNSHGEKVTCIAYEYLRQYCERASSIVEIAEPRLWPELAYLGRWSVQLGDHRGTLDLYHVPGMSKTSFEAMNLIDRKTGKLMEDRRLGTFFENGKPFESFRVNGEFTEDGLNLNIDWSEPGCSYSHRDGQEISLRFAGHTETMRAEILSGDGKGRTATAYRVRDKRSFAIERAEREGR